MPSKIKIIIKTNSTIACRCCRRDSMAQNRCRKRTSSRRHRLLVNLRFDRNVDIPPAAFCLSPFLARPRGKSIIFFTVNARSQLETPTEFSTLTIYWSDIWSNFCLIGHLPKSCFASNRSNSLFHL